jgi:putative ABC transport system ATP-binding protein
MPLLTLENVAYRYKTSAGYVEAVKSATYSFEEGKTYAIVGRSGSGKTTLMSLMAGLDLPWQGDIHFEEGNLKYIDRDIYRRSKMGMIFQSFYLLPQLTALENIEMTMEINGMSKEEISVRCHELLEKVGISIDTAKKRALKLSGGEQQRIAIARALGPNPRLILADEPTGNLDNENSENIIALLIKLAHEENRCVIIITHALELAKECDVILRMDNGVLVVTE